MTSIVLFRWAKLHDAINRFRLYLVKEIFINISVKLIYFF